ncbi:MAG: YbgC/FadM family acyl-CoA thioesterase [Caulobacterales bacterium]
MTPLDFPTAGRFDGCAHLLPVRIYYEDTDFSGLVYHANYLRYFERGRSDFLRCAGVDHTTLLGSESPTALTVTRMTLDFIRPARVDDALLVRTVYENVKGPRIFIAQAIWRGDEEIASAAVEACCISLTGRPKKPPLLLVERLKPFLERSASTF